MGRSESGALPPPQASGASTQRLVSDVSEAANVRTRREGQAGSPARSPLPIGERGRKPQGDGRRARSASDAQRVPTSGVARRRRARDVPTHAAQRVSWN